MSVDSPHVLSLQGVDSRVVLKLRITQILHTIGPDEYE